MTTEAPTRHASNRRDELIAAAATCFDRDGFGAASVRDIATEAGMQIASIYYHFESKDALFVAVHEEGLRRIGEATSAAIDGLEPGWDRLLAACTAHLETLLGGDTIFKAIMRPLPAALEIREPVVEMREGYEQIFRDLIDELELPSGTNRRHLRLMLLGAMNWSFTWFKGTRKEIRGLARSIVTNLRTGLEVTG